MRFTLITVIIITVISKITGFARELFLSYFYGTTDIADIYILSTTIPQIVFSFIFWGISMGFIPVYYDLVKKRDVIEAKNSRMIY